ncbi:acetate--CoA ligase family protein [Sediminispirochaeta bajacaliforniensis]|uniref:acetate--CoA ligase family protein n=1 Tax=Sediminispirochaeta bajacaliforniensis TaxID=148 RepID=UPI00036736EB|nr:acetate--CoA ligase family protein [Sediminispirochaeta bajacaliforniensis]
MNNILDWKSSEGLLSSWSLPFIPTISANGPDEAAKAAQDIGFPVALKAISPLMTHKSDHGLVHLNLAGANEVRNTCRKMAGIEGLETFLVQKMADRGLEMIAGIIRDPLFGPVVLFGPGGILVDLLDDSRMLRPPFREIDVRTCLREMKSHPLLNGYRGGKPLDIQALVGTLMRLGELALSLPKHIGSVDFNPVIVHDKGLSMVDLRISVTDGGAENE